MPKKNKQSNLNLAAAFVLVVFGLIVLSLFVKALFVFRDSRFDGSHNFIVGFVGEKQTKIASFSPQGKTISILDVDLALDKKKLSKALGVPIDGVIKLRDDNLQKEDISTVLLKSSFPFSKDVEGLTFVDTFRLSIFAKNVPSSSVYERIFPKSLNDSQKSTVLTLSFSDPTVFGENKNIQIINATDNYGLGTRLASLITNIGGNPVLVTTADEKLQKSKIIYYQDESYTVKKLSYYLDFPVEKIDEKGIADVIIVIGKDKVGNLNF